MGIRCEREGSIAFRAVTLPGQAFAMAGNLDGRSDNADLPPRFARARGGPRRVMPVAARAMRMNSHRLASTQARNAIVHP